MKTLAQEILDDLPVAAVAIPFGPTVADVAARLGADKPSVQKAFLQIAETGSAVIVRRKDGSRGQKPLRILLLSSGVHGCKVCHVEFVRPRKSTRVTCARKCAVALAWRDPEAAARRRASLSKAQSTPAAVARTKAGNRRRWARPGEREKLSQRNREMWADPVIKAKLSAAIQLVQQSPEMRKIYSDLRKEWWANPDWRQRMIEGIRKSKSTPEAKALFSKLLRERWRDPVLREKYLSAVRETARKRGQQMKGKKQQHLHIAKRVASTRKTKAARKAMSKS